MFTDASVMKADAFRKMLLLMWRVNQYSLDYGLCICAVNDRRDLLHRSLYCVFCPLLSNETQFTKASTYT